MNIVIIFLGMLILSGDSFATTTNRSEQLDDLCESYHLQVMNNSASECKDQLEMKNKTIAQNVARIIELQAEVDLKDETLRESQKKLIENQDDIKKLKEIIEQKDQEVSKLKEQIKTSVDKLVSSSCAAYGNSNGVHNIMLPNFAPFLALCNSDIAGPGWNVIQQRINGGEDFYRNWETYKNGFGNFTGDFFLGLERIHRLTKDTPHELYIYMEVFPGWKYERSYRRSSFYARYDNFRIAGEEDRYRLLSLGLFSGSADWDRMRSIEYQQFSTFDSDNDEIDDIDCAKERHAGWWFNSCGQSNLNGKYYQQEVYMDDSNWWTWGYSLKTIKMMIRPRGN